ncbi:GtrA family protein [Nocardioides sp. YIM 152315]|uniref:GtrA family protein n=1 Tax=Nocardioides sp. YIM 152315 TaxID=3031760 RepID=UPI0023DC7BBF|nr:GtrA family protein [Nocardioides sp. YIM 152315]MDF1602969.1 GtrA family protein [Nocardioides sp. YIM 152315]
MAGRWHRIFTEAYRFLAVGGLATLVALVIFNFLLHGLRTGWEAPLSGNPYLAFVIANVVGMTISYRGSRTWVFRDRPPRTADGGRLMFIAINFVTMLIPIACLGISRNALGLDDPYSDNVSANVLGLFLGMVARFYLFRTLVFRRPVHLADLKQHPLQVFELADLDSRAVDGPLAVSEATTGPSRRDPAPRRAP